LICGNCGAYIKFVKKPRWPQSGEPKKNDMHRKVVSQLVRPECPHCGSQDLEPRMLTARPIGKVVVDCRGCRRLFSLTAIPPAASHCRTCGSMNVLDDDDGRTLRRICGDCGRSTTFIPDPDDHRAQP
jgi:hypothetical protein